MADKIAGFIEKPLTITRLSKASWFKIESQGKVIHVDPGYTGYFENQGIPVEELEEKADIILISHPHKDHMQPEAIKRIIKDSTVIIAPFEFAHEKSNKTIKVSPGDSISVGDIKIVAVDAYNTKEGESTRKVHHKGVFVGYLIDFGSKSIYFAGDTDLIQEMKDLGKVDVALLPIGGTFVMNAREAAAAVEIINSKTAIPMHQSKNDPEEFKREVESKSDTKVIILKPGDKMYE